VESTINEYNDLQDDTKSDEKTRKSKYMTLVNAYYNVSTIFYEWGWGASFHFAQRLRDETFTESIKRHEYYLASLMNIREGDKVLDVGCGIGGPLRNIAKFNGARITGINNNAYQIKRGNLENKYHHLDKTCELVKADFNKLPFGSNIYDAAYTIEATCHSPRREDVFGQLFRVLKPGAYFVGYEWCLTDRFDEKSPQHMYYKKCIEVGNGLPTCTHTSVVDNALKNVGFEMVFTKDLAEDVEEGGLPWYEPLEPSLWNIKRFQFSSIGQILLGLILSTLELFCIAPKGTKKTSDMLNQAAIGLVGGGRTKTFTPMYLFVARKPLKK
jgi:sterol 24-C-methyltransferase